MHQQFKCNYLLQSFFLGSVRVQIHSEKSVSYQKSKKILYEIIVGDIRFYWSQVSKARIIILAQKFHKLSLFKLGCTNSDTFKACFYGIYPSSKSFFERCKASYLISYLDYIISIVYSPPKVFKNSKYSTIFHTSVFFLIKRYYDIKVFSHNLSNFNKFFKIFYI